VRALLSIPLVIVCLTCGCDRMDPPAARTSPADRAADEARARAKEAMSRLMSAAQGATSACVAADLHWEADPDGNLLARHYSRPCVTERCSPKPADIDALRAAQKALRALVDGEPALRTPSYQGFSALGDAMVGFIDTALAGTVKEQDKPSRLGGLSMHYGALAAAHKELFPESAFPIEPPSLTASLAEPGAGGDPCKGWAMPKYCDVKGVKVPKEHRWRSNPPCVEVLGIKK
jgi:hypothetical protein